MSMQQILDEIARHINEQRKTTGMLAQEIAKIKEKIDRLETQVDQRERIAALEEVIRAWNSGMFHENETSLENSLERQEKKLARGSASIKA
jgi:hypothetical protein